MTITVLGLGYLWWVTVTFMRKWLDNRKNIQKNPKIELAFCHSAELLGLSLAVRRQNRCNLRVLGRHWSRQLDTLIQRLTCRDIFCWSKSCIPIFFFFGKYCQLQLLSATNNICPNVILKAKQTFFGTRIVFERKEGSRKTVNVKTALQRWWN